jgi:hypothetical protein
MDVLTSETCLALNNEIKKQVTSVGVSLSNYVERRTEINKMRNVASC